MEKGRLIHTFEETFKYTFQFWYDQNLSLKKNVFNALNIFALKREHRRVEEEEEKLLLLDYIIELMTDDMAMQLMNAGVREHTIEQGFYQHGDGYHIITHPTHIEYVEKGMSSHSFV